MSVFTRAPHTPSEISVSTRALLLAEEEAPLAASAKEGAAGTSCASAPLQRLVARDLPFNQSSNSLRVRHQACHRSKHQHALIFPLRFFHWYVEDWFHVLLRLRTLISVVMLVAVWTLFLLLFAAIYVYVDKQEPDVDCGLGKEGSPIKFHGAFAFSLETTTTVGYGLPNGVNGFFEEGCPELLIAVYFQMVISMFFNAFLLSFMFARLARCEARAAQVLFSDKAIITREVLPSGIVRYVLSARVYDADSMYPIVEAHCRFYAVKHRDLHSNKNKGVRYPLKFEPMRVSVPNDDLGALLYTSIPTRVMHHIDYHSPIIPPSIRKLGPEDGRVKGEFVMDPCGLSLRENDSYTGGQDGLRCVICGETYGTVANLIQHIRYNQHTEKHDDVPVVGSHQELDVDALFKDRRPPHKESQPKQNEAESSDKRIDIDKPTSPWYQEYEQYLRESNVEIVCVMEAIDPIMSGTFAAVQSYTADDIVFDADFAPCVLSDPITPNLSQFRLRCARWLRRMFVGRSAVGRSVKVDLDTFHDTVEIGEG